ncbi:MAG TPA: Ig-like domain repeat protein [Terracidiphilus sp.]|nr:Ig-like domain repeat protein [Terracidiphilus sp.]
MKRLLSCLTFALALVSALSAQQNAISVPSRITGPIDESHLVTLKGNVHPLARAQFDRGPVNPSLPLTDLILVLRRSPEQQAAFDAFVASQYDPNSPDFHRWLAPADVAARFGPAAADVSVISAWLASRGLRVSQVAPDRMSIRFGGTAAQVQAAFHTSLHNLSVNGESHIANMTDPQIPAALAPVVLGVKALHNFLPRPQHRLGSLVTFNRATGRWQRVASAAAAKTGLGGVRPDFGITIGTGSSAYTIEDVAPYDFATIYNVLPLWNASTPIDGTGQTIAIAGTSDINLNDVSSFRSLFGLPAGTAPKIVVANGVDPGQCTATVGACTIDDLYENSLDVEWSGAVAKGASIVLVVSGPTSPTTDTIYSSANYVVQNSTAKILSVSYGECELGMGTAGNAAYNNLWETAATEGIAVFVASGDAGSAACDQGQAQQVPYAAQFGLSVSGMASTPFDTAIGGTDLNWGATPSPYWNSTNNSTTGASAAGYMPEVPWNDTCTNPLILPILQEWAATLNKNGYTATSPTDAESACNFVNQWYSIIYQGTDDEVDLSGLVNTVGGGGGASNCTTSDGSTVASCSGGYTKPSWQTGVTGIPADNARYLPDVSFFAGNGFLGSAYLVCVSAAGPCLTTTSPTTEPVAQEVGGTSAGTPAMAGVMALINQKMGASQGSPNAELYSIAAKESYGSCSSETPGSSCSFHDIDTGTNAMACASGSPDCTINNSGDTFGVLSGYAATAGFDPATGLGSLNVANVVNAWTSTVGTTAATVTVTPAQSSIFINQALSVTAQVSGASGTPTGDLTIVTNGYDGGVQSVSSAGNTFNIPANTLPAGSVTLTASYAGDSTYAEASGTATVTVTKLTPTVTVQLNPSSVGANTTITATVTVAGGPGDPTPTGYVSIPKAVGTCSLVSGSCSLTIGSDVLPNGNDTITATYNGDANYEEATGSAVETVNILTATVTVTPSASTVSAASSLPVTIKVTGAGATPTGHVALSTPDTTYPPGMNCNLSGGQCTITIPPASLTGLTDVLTASYGGDSTYLAAQGSATVSVTPAATTLTVSPSSTSITTNLPLTLTGTVTATANPAVLAWGTITVNGGGYSASFTASSQPDQYSFTIPPGSLSPGTDTLTLTYAGQSIFNPSTATTSVNVTQWVKVAPTITVTPASSSISPIQPLQVNVSVSGPNGVPTGTFTLTSGSWNSGAFDINNGAASVQIASGTLPVGTDTITANYSGDLTYLPGTATTTVTVAPSTFTLTAGSPPSVSPGQQASVNVTLQSTNGYSGQVTLTCAVTSQPSGAVDPPTCTGGTVPLQGGSDATTVLVSTTAATAFNSRPALRGLTGLGGAALAFLVFLGVPARRRAWRNLLGLLVLAFVFAGLGACGGGGSNSGGGGGGNSGTTAGSYTFTVTGTGNPAISPAPTTTFTLTVN